MRTASREETQVKSEWFVGAIASSKFNYKIDTGWTLGAVGAERKVFKQ